MVAVTYAIRAKQLHERIQDLNYKLDELNETKASLLTAGDDLMPPGTDYDPDSPQMKTLKARRERIKILERQIDKKIRDYTNALKAAEAQYDGLESKVTSALTSELKSA